MSGDSGTSEATGTGGDTPFTLTEPWDAKEACTPDAKDACDDIPAENRATMIGGQNVMPTITWTAGPEGTTNYALVFQDLAFLQNGKPAVHWVMWGVPADVTSVGSGNIPSGAQQAAGFNLAAEWFGSGNCNNVYELSVYALKGDVTATQAAAVRDALEADTAGELVLARDYARVTPRAPCGNQ